MSTAAVQQAAKAFAAAFQLDPATWKQGYADGLRGIQQWPSDWNCVLAYAAGFAEGQQERSMRAKRAAPKPEEA